MNAREMPYGPSPDELLVAPTIPSMSSPRCVCASKISRPAGRSATQPLVPSGRDLPCPFERLHVLGIYPPGARVVCRCVSTPPKDTVVRRAARVPRSVVTVSPRSEALMKRMRPARPLTSPRPAAGSRLGARQRRRQHRRRRRSSPPAATPARRTRTTTSSSSTAAATGRARGWTLQYASAAGTAGRRRRSLGRSPPAVTTSSSSPREGRTAPRCLRRTRPAPRTSPSPAGRSRSSSSATALSCGAAAGSCSGVSGVEDLVGYGTATDYEGSAAAPAPSKRTKALARAGGGCTDVDDNAADFAACDAGSADVGARPRRVLRAAVGRRLRRRRGVDVDVQPVLSLSLDHTSLSFPAAVPGTIPRRPPSRSP